MGPNVTIGPGTVLRRRVSVTGHVTIGSDNLSEDGCILGTDPQDLKYAGEATRLEIGDDNLFREFVSFHRGTAGGGGVTSIGSKNLFMAYVHVAHDCHVGSGTIFANNATLAGHVEVEDSSTVGALSAIHQFTRIGQHAFLGAFTAANKDCLPYMSTVGNRPPRCYGPNTIGLERKGFSPESRKALKSLWRILHDPKLNTSEALARIREELGGQQEVEPLGPYEE